MKPRFLRSDTVRHKRLGKNRRRLQKWRRPRGRHSKIRRNRFGYPVVPSVGYKSVCAHSGKIKGLVPVRVHTLADVEKVTSQNIIIIARVGARNRQAIFKRANEKGIMIDNPSIKEGTQ